jgi:type I restriction enzyme S subunit
LSELPETWAECTIGEVCKVVGGGTPPSKDPDNFTDDGGMSWITPADLSGYRKKYIKRGRRNLTPEGLANSSAKPIPTGTVLFSSRAPVGYVVIAANEVATNQGFKSFLVPLDFDSSYLYYYLRHIKPEAEARATGTTFKELSGSAAAKLPLLIAPSREQKRIADKLDAVLARVDTCRERLDRVPHILKKFREAVLETAVSGKLTEEWREVHPLSQSAEEMVQQRGSSRAGRLRVRAEGAAVTNLDLPELPSSWAWISNHRLAADSESAICAGPFGTIFKAKDFRSEGVPIIFLRHVAAGQYLTTKPGYMDERMWRENHQPYSIFGGELLVTKLGDPPGTACIYPKGRGVAMVTPDVMKMTVDEAVALPRFLMYYFNSRISQGVTRQLAFGVTRLRIDLSMFKHFPIPLPPLAEQSEVVRRVDELFELADALYRKYRASSERISNITPSLLAKAFRGKLVPQDPNDEPAGEMLERIRAIEPANASIKRTFLAAGGKRG